MIKTIDSFRGDHRFLSNFWPVKVKYEGLIYPSVEHAYQASKTMDFNLREKICDLPSAGKSKSFWDINKNPEPTANWETKKLLVMNDLVSQKFSLHGETMLLKLFVDTDPAVITEGNTHGDVFWGKVKEDDKWVGENHLGIILMDHRQYLINVKNQIINYLKHNPHWTAEHAWASIQKNDSTIFRAKMAFGIK